MKRIAAALAVPALILGLSMPTQAGEPTPTGRLIDTEAEAAVAACGTQTRETVRTFNNIYHPSYDFKVRYRTNFYQCPGTTINWMQICVIQGTSYLNSNPYMYDIDRYIYNSTTGVYERTYDNASSGSNTCHTWYPNEYLNTFDAVAGYKATLNVAQAPDIRGSSAHFL